MPIGRGEGKPTPVAPLFDRLAERWSAVPDNGTLVVCWPMSTTAFAEPRRVMLAATSAAALLVGIVVAILQ